MQEVFITKPQLNPIRVYDTGMHPGGRPTKKSRSALGDRIAKARERAGISQAELAKKLNTTQPAIAYWERSAVNLRSDVLAKLAEILGVSADELLGTQVSRRQKTQATGKANQMFSKVSKLPRRQQQKILDVVEAFVEKQEAKGS